MLESIRKRHLWVNLYFFSNAPLAYLICLRWFARWEVVGCTAAVLWGFASSICAKQQTAFMCSSHLAFSPCNSLGSRWCIHIIILTQPQLGKNPALFYYNLIFFFRRKGAIIQILRGSIIIVELLILDWWWKTLK